MPWERTLHARKRQGLDGDGCRRRRNAQEPPRDEFLRPMVDTTGIRYRIGLNEDEMTEDIREEFEENQRESWAALRFAGEFLEATYLLPCSSQAKACLACTICFCSTDVSLQPLSACTLICRCTCRRADWGAHRGGFHRQPDPGRAVL